MARKCLFPFSNLTINPTGSVAPCCKYDLLNPKKGDTELDKETLYNKNFLELFNQPSLAKLRQDFIDGKEPDGCKVCWDEEAAGVTSLRQHREKHSNKYKGVLENPRMLTLDFKFSSLCNLKCRICGPYCSSTWLKESSDLSQFDPNTMKIFSKYSERKFANNEENFNVLKQIISEIHLMEFYGGEPLMQPEHSKIMSLIKEGSNKKIELFYNTNGTVYDQSAVDVWNMLSSVEINISIDDIMERFEYQRFPAKWEDVLSNIKRFKENCSNNVRINMYCTISMYNIYYLDQLIKYNCDNLQLPIRFNLVHWPSCMSIQHLPFDVKSQIAKKIERLSADDISYIEQGFSIDNIITYMNNNEGSEEELETFFSKTRLHDQYRHQSFANTFEEYYRVLGEYDEQVVR